MAVTLTPIGTGNTNWGSAVDGYWTAITKAFSGDTSSPNSYGNGVIGPLNVSTGLSVGSYAGVYSAPSDGIIVNGSVGIGTTTPNYPLDIWKTNAGAVTVALNLRNNDSGSTGTGVALAFTAYGSDVVTGRIANIRTAAGQYALTFSNWDGGGDTEHMRIDTTGRLIINGTAVSGSGRASLYWDCSSQEGLSFQAINSSFSGSGVVAFRNSSAGVSGYIGQSTSAVTYNTSSDRRIKENIALTTLGLDALMRLPIRDFDFINDHKQTKVTGFIAQELYDVFPSAVTTNGDNGTKALGASAMPWGVDYGRVTPLLAKAIQELNDKVDAMVSRVAAISTPMHVLQP